MKANEFLSLSNGTFTLSETPIKNHFYFYRNDGEKLGRIDSRKPLEFFQAYIIRKIITGEIADSADYQISYDRSADDRCLILIVSDNDNIENNLNQNSCAERPNFFKRLLKKIFG